MVLLCLLFEGHIIRKCDFGHIGVDKIADIIIFREASVFKSPFFDVFQMCRCFLGKSRLKAVVFPVFFKVFCFQTKFVCQVFCRFIQMIVDILRTFIDSLQELSKSVCIF